MTLLPLSLLAAGLAQAADVNITNELTENHIEAPGTAAYFVPAKGMSPSDRFSGFASDTRNIEVIVANIKSPYKTISEAFTESTLLTRGLEVGSTAELSINGSDATLLKALHKDGGKKWGKWILLLDSGKNTLVVNGVFVSGDGDAAKDVEAMIKSVVVKDNERPGEGADASGTDILDGAGKELALALSSDLSVSPDEKMVVNDENTDKAN
jgi:hypothetical protein